MTDSSTVPDIDQIVRVFNQNNDDNTRQSIISSLLQDQWLANSIYFREIAEETLGTALSEEKKVPLSHPSTTETPNQPTVSDEPTSSGEKVPREIKLYSPAQFRSHINRLYPFHLDYFCDKLSALDTNQHRMGLYVFYDVENGYLIGNIEKESNKKTDRGKNMKRMNGLLLNEHRMFNQYAKEYAVAHLNRDYETIKPAVNEFMQAWLKRKTETLLKHPNSTYQQRMTIPLNTYDSLEPVSFTNLSIVLRLGTLPLLTVPDNIGRGNIKCSDNHDRMVSNRFNAQYRLTNLSDDPNILAIVSQHPSIDVVLAKSSFRLLIELFSSATSALLLPFCIREFEIPILETTTNTSKKKILFIDKPYRQRTYTKRELNSKYFQRAFRSLLLTTTGGKRQETDSLFNYNGLNDRTEFQVTEIKKKIAEKSPIKQEKEQQEKIVTDDDDDDDDAGMVITTDGDIEEQQKTFSKSKQKIIQAAPILQERTQTNDNESNRSSEPVPVSTRVQLTTPIQGNYDYSIWQLGTLQLLIRSSYHGFCRHTTNNTDTDEFVTCYSKLEYQPQFGFEQITDKEYRSLWFESYLRQGSSILIGRINVFNQQLFKMEKMTYADIDQNLKQCQIDMMKPLGKLYGFLYGLQSLEPNHYLLSSPLNDEKIDLYQPASEESNEPILDLHSEPFETNSLLVESDRSTVPWIPLTPTLLTPYHIDFERIPLTFCPRHKRTFDIDITIPPRRRKVVVHEQKNNDEKKKRKKTKKKRLQRQKKSKAMEQS